MLDFALHEKPSTIAEAVRSEALAVGYRREVARQPGGANRGLLGRTAPLFAVGDHIRELAAELDAEELAANDDNPDRRVATPSALIRTMRADWPDQRAAVEAYAKAEGLPLGEAWARLIATAVGVLRNGGGE